jgi:hypothetical protein
MVATFAGLALVQTRHVGPSTCFKLDVLDISAYFLNILTT